MRQVQQRFCSKINILVSQHASFENLRLINYKRQKKETLTYIVIANENHKP